MAIAGLDRFVYTFIERRMAGPPRDELMSLLISARDASGAPLSMISQNSHLNGQPREYCKAMVL